MNTRSDDHTPHSGGQARPSTDSSTAAASGRSPVTGRVPGDAASGECNRARPASGDLANQAADAIRALTHATRPGAADYEYPADVYVVVGSLGRLVQDLPQSLRQAVRWLADTHARGGVRDVDAGTEAETAQTVCAVILELSEAATHAGRAANSLRDAHAPAARLAGVDVDAPIPFLPTETPTSGGAS
jgi:hypothetical protein